MKKSIYIIVAIVIAAGLTVAQALIAQSIIKKNEMEVCTAAVEIKKGNVINEDDIKTIKIYKGEYSGMVLAAGAYEVCGKKASRDIMAGDILCMGDIGAEDETAGETGYVALEVKGSNFGAGRLETGDFADLYIIPDFTDVEDEYIVWLNGVFAESGVRFIPGKQPGILIENVLIDHINTATGQEAKYVNIRVSSPLDEAIAFLEQISVYEFIGR